MNYNCRFNFHFKTKLKRILRLVFILLVTSVITLNLVNINLPPRTDVEEIPMKDLDYPLSIDLWAAFDVHKGISNNTWLPPPLNPEEFNVFLQNHDNICPEESKNSLLILVRTDAKSFDRRQLIRTTWGAPQCMERQSIASRTFFIIGMPEKLDEPSQLDIQKRILSEHQQFKDIIQFDMVDTYRNLSYKLATSLRYFTQHCPNVRFIHSIDDDFLVHPANLAKELSRVPHFQYPIYFGGYVFDGNPVIRNGTSKWALSIEELPTKQYPIYSAGGSMLFSRPMAELIAFGFKFTKYLHIDDVMIGLILRRLRILPIHLPGIYILRQPVPEELASMIASHHFSDQQTFMNVWEKLKEIGAC